MRLFLAIELPADVREHLRRVQEAVRDRAGKTSWTRLENIHLTLKFLGDVADEQLPRICDALAALEESGPIDLEAAGLELFPPRGPFRVIAAAMSGDDQPLRELHARVESACEPLGHAREQRRYRPHATLGRPRAPLASAARPDMEEATQRLWPGPACVITQFVLMQSQLHPEGSRYTPLARFEI